MQLTVRVRIWLLLLAATFATGTYAQSVLPFDKQLRIEHERHFINQGKQYHPIYPMVVETDSTEVFFDEILSKYHFKTGKTIKGRIKSKLFYESLIRVDTMGFKLRIDPMFCFEAGRESTDMLIFESSTFNGGSAEDGNNKWKKKGTWTNTRGIRAEGAIGKQFAFYSAFYETQAVLQTWMDSKTRELHVVPGQAMYKLFRNNGFDYAFAEGHISYSPSKYFNFRLGHGKNFIGDGYRSVLLSDVAFNYPYLAINTKVWHLQYLNLFSQHQDIMAPKGKWHPWAKKYSTTHYLSWNVFPWLNIGLFESIIWQASDSTGQRGFELQYLNPVIFYRPVEFSLGSPDNALLGGSVRVTVLRKNILYGQLMLDEFKLEHVIKGDGWWANKHGLQVGVKSFDPFNVPNLYLQAEYNHVRPYTYAHNTHLQNYAHYNQPLAHPQGANFREVVLIADKRITRWRFDYKMVYAQYGADTAGLNFGHDLFRSYYDYVSEFDNKIGQGLKTTLLQHDLTAGWLINPATNLSFSATLTLRSEKSALSETSSTFIVFSFRSAVFNRYDDF
jgi:hypothetical protein